MAKCEKYIAVDPSIATVTYAKCGTYKGSNNVLKTSSLEGELILATEEDVADESNFLKAEQLPDIYSEGGLPELWPDVYTKKGKKFKQRFDDDKKAVSYRSTSLTNAVTIQSSCSTYRGSGKDIDGQKFTNVRPKTPIALFNQMQKLYDSIKKELALLDIRTDIDNNHNSAALLAELNVDDPETGVPIMPPCNHNPSGGYTYDHTKIKNTMLIRNDIFYRLNDILKEYSSKVTDIRIRMKVANADDSINKLMSNYQSAILGDCICYSDCISYSVCFCYGNCNHY